MRKLTYLAVLEPASEGYGVYFPDLPGCISCGKDIQEAKKNRIYSKWIMKECVMMSKASVKFNVIKEQLMEDEEFKAEYEKLKTQYEVISKIVFPVIFTHADDGILVEVPDLEIFTEGDNMDDAIAMARDAIELKILCIQDNNQEIPTPSELSQIDAATGTFAAYGESIVLLVDLEIVCEKGAADNA